MNKIISYVFLLIVALNCSNSIVFAVDSTPSADIKSKLEMLKKEIASKAAMLKNEIDRKLTNKVFVGKVKQKSENGLTLASSSGPKIITINQDTEFESWVKGKKFSQKTMAEEDYTASLGDVDETGVLIAKRIILLPSPKTPKTILWGEVIAISDKLVTLKNKDDKNISVSLNSKVAVNQFVILTGNVNENDIFEAGFVYIIPQGGILRSKKIATPSAEASSSSKNK